MKKIYNINHNNVINLVSLKYEGNRIYYNFDIKGKISKYFNCERLWIEFPFAVENVPLSIQTIPFAATTMSLAWITGSIIHVPAIDETFYNAFPTVRQKFQEMFPTLPMGGSLYSDEIISNMPDNSMTTEACMFSGGMDAITTFVRHKKSVKHLIYTNGLISTPEKDDKVFNHETGVISDFAKRYGINTIFIRSNFYNFINQTRISSDFKKHISGFWHDLYHSMAFLGLSSIACYEYNVSKVYIGSSNTITPWHPCASDPTTDTAVRFMNTRISHDGFGLTRQDKTRVIVEEKRNLGLIDYPLHVCSFNDHNCCKCEKCLRTMWSLIAENEDPRNYGFKVGENLSEFISKAVEENIALMGFSIEEKIYWPHIKEQMKKHYKDMSPELQAAVDWFFTYDFHKAKNEGVRKYYRQNFWSILKRKFHIK